jgi:hypothetical protein
MEEDMIIYVYWSSCKVTIIHVRFHLEFSRQGFKNTQILHFMKFRPVIAELVNAEGQRIDGRT